MKKGQKASMVVFWKQHEVDNKETGEKKTLPVLRYYNVFNVDQCDGIKSPDAVISTGVDYQPVDAVDAIVKGYTDPPTIEYGGGKP